MLSIGDFFFLIALIHYYYSNPDQDSRLRLVASHEARWMKFVFIFDDISLSFRLKVRPYTIHLKIVKLSNRLKRVGLEILKDELFFKYGGFSPLQSPKDQNDRKKQETWF